jgi:hypothetical protein
LKRAIYQTFFLIHALSIDIAVGAVGLGWAVLKIFTQKLNILGPIQTPSELTLQLKLIPTLQLTNPSELTLQLKPIPAWPILLLLFLGTLIVYWTDHLQDSKNVQMVVRGERHAMFFRNRRWFEVGLGIMISAAGYIALTYLSLIQLVFGILLLGLHVGYLLFHRKLRRGLILEKELWVGFLYMLSILFVPLALCMPFTVWDYLAILLLGLLIFLVCMQNLFSIARMEREVDEAVGIRNGVAVFGEHRMQRLQKLMMLLQLVASLILLFSTLVANMVEPTNSSLTEHAGQSMRLMVRLLGAFMLVGLLNYLLPWLFGSDRKNSWYRIAGDGVFLLFFWV